MRLISVKKRLEDGKAILSAQIDSQQFGNNQYVYFSYPEKYFDYLSETADPFFAAMLIPAMMTESELEIVPPLSQKILENQSIIQDIFAVWHPGKLSRVKIIANSLITEPGQGKGLNATFFSLGVDSMYSMLKYLPRNEPPPGKELNSLIYMKGLELPLSTYCNGQDKAVVANMMKVADHYNLDLVVGETNIRDVFPLNWEYHYYGPGLGATALSLSNGFSIVFIPSSHSYAFIYHDPSSPLIDGLWSNENTCIFHDGSEKERAEKVADLIVHDPFALGRLRVCVANEGGDYNCGKCWKCVRTMVTLEILGRLKDSESFPGILPKNFNVELRTYNPVSLEYTRENLKLAKRVGHKEMINILSREVRIGSLDILRNGMTVSGFVKDVLLYCYLRLGKKNLPRKMA